MYSCRRFKIGNSAWKRIFNYAVFFTDTAPTEFYTLSLHDALPILIRAEEGKLALKATDLDLEVIETVPAEVEVGGRSEEHTSELQSRRDLVCRLLLEKKKVTI